MNIQRNKLLIFNSIKRKRFILVKHMNAIIVGDTIMGIFELKNIFIINFIIMLIFSLGFLLMPDEILTSMGLATYADSGEPIRFFGAMLFGMAIILFGVRNEPHSSMRQYILLSLICSFVIQIVFHLLFHPLTNFIVLFVIALDVIFVVLYAYFLIMNQSAGG